MFRPGRAETETLDNAAAHRAILDRMTNAEQPWPPEVLAFLKSLTDTEELAALYRAFEQPLTENEGLELLQRKVQERQGGRQE